MEKKELLDSIMNLSSDVLPTAIVPLLNAMGIPTTPQSMVIATKMAKTMWDIGFVGIIKDFQDRHLSKMQQTGLDETIMSALDTYYSLMKRDGWNDVHPESAIYIQNAIEYSEDLLSKAINECKKAKRLFLGAYLGSTLYHLNISSPNWENVYYLSSLLNRLTLRQIILIKLVNNHFDRIEDSEDIVCVTNKVAISELKELANQNMWVGLISYQPDPTYIAIPLKYMYPTELAKELIGSILIPDSIEQSVNDIIESLDLKPYSMTGLPDSFIIMIKRKLNQSILQ